MQRKRGSRSPIPRVPLHGKQIQYLPDELAGGLRFLKQLLSSPQVNTLFCRGVDQGEFVEFIFTHAPLVHETDKEFLQRAKEIRTAHRAYSKFIAAFFLIRDLPHMGDFDEIQRDSGSGCMLSLYEKLVTRKRPAHRPKDFKENSFILDLARLVKKLTGQFCDELCCEIFYLTFKQKTASGTYQTRRKRLWKTAELAAQFPPRFLPGSTD